ncbi:unnamed protein product [Caenorhabditis angaria]|uniref:Protein kinase domain-containing protein n=1 Tax=Caenorhabditis angaria TaxID=860376 RepID=A0A9P1IVU0_9PELO|nr:unnamed protein product [Caenorhabditis angaria]
MVANNSIDLIDQNETSIIIGAGKGHLSTVSLYEDKNLVRKIPITEPSKVLAVPLKQERFQTMHNTELIIYEILKNHHEANISHPKIFDSQEMNVKSNVTGYLLMEYISGCEHVYLFENLNPEHLIEPIKQIARFHAIKLSENEQGKVPKNMLTSWMAELFCEAVRLEHVLKPYAQPVLA